MYANGNFFFLLLCTAGITRKISLEEKKYHLSVRNQGVPEKLFIPFHSVGCNFIYCAF